MPPSADKNVLVTFTPPNDWTFTLHVTPMKRPGKLRLKQPKGAAWTFVGAEVPDGGDQFTPSGSGRQVTIDNKHTRLGAFDYTVTVRQGAETYRSPVRRAGGGDAPDTADTPNTPDAPNAPNAPDARASLLAFGDQAALARPPQIVNET